MQSIIFDAIILDVIIFDAIILDDKYLMQSYLGKGKRLAGKSDIACFGIDASFCICKSRKLKYYVSFGIWKSKDIGINTFAKDLPCNFFGIEFSR